jgi:hypothetical protein
LVELIRVSKDAGGVGKQDYGMNKKWNCFCKVDGAAVTIRHDLMFDGFRSPSSFSSFIDSFMYLLDIHNS